MTRVMFDSFRSFAQQSTLLVHTKRHTGEKNFTCGVCQQSFVIKRRLQEHIRTHTGERPYQCELCPFKAAISSGLKYHMRTHMRRLERDPEEEYLKLAIGGLASAIEGEEGTEGLITDGDLRRNRTSKKKAAVDDDGKNVKVKRSKNGEKKERKKRKTDNDVGAAIANAVQNAKKVIGIQDASVPAIMNGPVPVDGYPFGTGTVNDNFFMLEGASQPFGSQQNDGSEGPTPTQIIEKSIDQVNGSIRENGGTAIQVADIAGENYPDSADVTVGSDSPHTILPNNDVFRNCLEERETTVIEIDDSEPETTDRADAVKKGLKTPKALMGCGLSVEGDRQEVREYLYTLDTSFNSNGDNAEKEEDKSNIIEVSDGE